MSPSHVCQCTAIDIYIAKFRGHHVDINDSGKILGCTMEPDSVDKSTDCPICSYYVFQGMLGTSRRKIAFYSFYELYAVMYV